VVPNWDAAAPWAVCNTQGCRELIRFLLHHWKDIFKMSPKLNPNCYGFATRCRKLYFCFVGCRKPKKVGNHWSREIQILYSQSRYGRIHWMEWLHTDLTENLLQAGRTKSWCDGPNRSSGLASASANWSKLAKEHYLLASNGGFGHSFTVLICFNNNISIKKTFILPVCALQVVNTLRADLQYIRIQILA